MRLFSRQTLRRQIAFTVGFFVVLSVILTAVSWQTLVLAFGATEGSTARVYATDCSDHNMVYYRFDVGNEYYHGRDTPAGVLRCQDLKSGDRVAVLYWARSPGINTLRNPADD